MSLAPSPDSAAVDRLFIELSNWNRWGPDDQRGTLNLIGDAERMAAAGLVRTGQSVSLSRRIRPRSELDNPDPAIHLMKRSGEAAPEHGYSSAADWIGMGFHGFGTTHLDALCHVMWSGQLYNGFEARSVTTARGARQLSVENFDGGIVGRGVLLDAPRALEVPWLEPGSGLSPDDLDRCERAAGTKVRRGDVLLVRTGRDARRQALGAHNPLRDGFPGLLPSCLPWLHERDVAVLGSDAVSDVMIPGTESEHLMPVHVIALVAMGMPLLDNLLLEALSQACVEAGRAEFLFSAGPLLIQGGTGSPITPIALL